MIQFLLDTTSGGGSLKDNWVLLVLVGVLLIVFMVLPIFTQNRDKKKYKAMIDKIRIGDEIKTIGGIVGKIIEIKDISATEKQMVIETGVGDNKSTLVLDMNAIFTVTNPTLAPEEDQKTDSLDKPADADKTE
ncbi:MAG TPA: preprotein translocase subunit YajC [Clostridia bacterium]